eukprot:538017-Rhodomonas_salina.2
MPHHLPPPTQHAPQVSLDPLRFLPFRVASNPRGRGRGERGASQGEEAAGKNDRPHCSRLGQFRVEPCVRSRLPPDAVRIVGHQEEIMLLVADGDDVNCSDRRVLVDALHGHSALALMTPHEQQVILGPARRRVDFESLCDTFELNDFGLLTELGRFLQERSRLSGFAWVLRSEEIRRDKG